MKLLNQRGDNRQAGVTWGQRVGNDECPYLRRWVFNFGPGSLRVHHWYAGDDPRSLHDHPWWFLTVVVKGGYTDISSTKPGSARREFYSYDDLRAPAVRFRPALHAHTVSVHEGGCWTVMLTGRHMRDWGFYTREGWLRMRAYFREHGHHPCE